MIKAKASFYLTCKFSLLKITVLINFPLEVSNAVLSTYARQLAFSGRTFID